MADKLEPIALTFGGGINRRRRPFDIHPEECFTGQNFDLNQQSSVLLRRKPFDLKATTPNAQEIRGYAQVKKRDGTVSQLIQSGGNVYSWDGSSTFTLVGTCNPGSKLRGKKSHNFTLDDLVIITDLEKATVVKTWDGTTFTNMTTNLASPLYAKYCLVRDERAYFGNVQSGTDTPHVILGSAISDKSTLTITDRPSSSLSDGDPFFLPTPDLKPINGMEEGFGQFIISTQSGKLMELNGFSAKDFEVISLYEGSFVSGDESMVNIGNDVALAMPGRIEMLSDTQKFGDVATDDSSILIQPLIQDVTSWTATYNQLTQKVFFLPNSGGKLWVLHKSLMGGEFSPWSQWVTDHSLNFNPSTIWTMIDPGTGLDATYMGDASGNIYRLEGSGAQDGGTTDISVKRQSIVYRLPTGRVFDLKGWIIYDKAFEETITLTFQYAGTGDVDQAINILIPAAGSGSAAVYSGTSYYGSSTVYYNTGFSGRLARRNWAAAGDAYQLQVLVTIEGARDFAIHEIGLTLMAVED